MHYGIKWGKIDKSHHFFHFRQTRSCFLDPELRLTVQNFIIIEYKLPPSSEHRLTGWAFQSVTTPNEDPRYLAFVDNSRPTAS